MRSYLVLAAEEGPATDWRLLAPLPPTVELALPSAFLNLATYFSMPFFLSSVGSTAVLAVVFCGELMTAVMLVNELLRVGDGV